MYVIYDRVAGEKRALKKAPTKPHVHVECTTILRAHMCRATSSEKEALCSAIVRILKHTCGGL